MTILYDATAEPRVAHIDAQMPMRGADYSDLPDLYRPARRRRVPPMAVAMVAFVVATGAFYGAEAVLPPEFKPSHFTGGYAREMAAAKAAGELSVRIDYDAKLKVMETAAALWQEQCKAGLQNFNNFYQAAYARANAYAAAAADMQKQYAAVRYGLAQNSVGGELGAANMATSFGYLFQLFDPALGQKARDFAQEAREQAYQKLDEAARSGITVSVDGWDIGLPQPGDLPPMLKCDLPSSLVPAAQPSTGG